MNKFDKEFNGGRKMFNIFFIFTTVLIILALIGTFILGYYILSDPEGVGEYFGKIVNGFNK